MYYRYDSDTKILYYSKYSNDGTYRYDPGDVDCKSEYMDCVEVVANQVIQLPADCSYMFSGLQDLVTVHTEKMDFSNVVNMSHMFENCKSFKIHEFEHLGNFINVRDLSYTFAGCTSFYYDPRYATGVFSIPSSLFMYAVTCSHMFDGCVNLNELPLTDIKINNFRFILLEDASYMFANCTALQSLPDNDAYNPKNNTGYTPRLQNVSHMFYNCKVIDGLDLSSGDTSHLTDVTSMFEGCKKMIALNLCTGNPLNVENENMDRMFAECTHVEKIYVAFEDRPGGEESTASGTNMFQGCLGLPEYDPTVTDLQKAARFTRGEGYFTREYDIDELYYMYDSEERIVHFSNYDGGDNGLRWYPVEKEKYSEIGGTHEYENCVAIDILPDTLLPKNSSTMFLNCSELLHADLSNFIGANMISIDYFFYGCTNLRDITCADLLCTKLESAEYVFRDCTQLGEIDLSNGRTPALISMYHIFDGCTRVSKIDISNGDPIRCENFAYAFRNCEMLEELDLSTGHAPKGQRFDHMFEKCKSLSKLDISNITFDEVTTTDSMFADCKYLDELFMMSCVGMTDANISSMFYECSNLMHVYAGDDPDGRDAEHNPERLLDPFVGCEKIMNGNGVTNLSMAFNSQKGGYLETYPSEYVSIVPLIYKDNQGHEIEIYRHRK